MEREQLERETFLLYHGDYKFHAIVEEAVMFARSRVIIPMAPDQMKKLVQLARISAAAALVLQKSPAEKTEETKPEVKSEVNTTCSVSKRSGWGMLSRCVFTAEHDGAHSWVADI